jgi:hypothetical protein
VGETTALNVGVTMPPVTDTLTRIDVPWTTSPFVGEITVIFTGDEGRCPRPPDGVGYGVGAGVPELVGPPEAVAEPQAVTHTSTAVRRTSNGRRIVQFPAHAIMSSGSSHTG